MTNREWVNSLSNEQLVKLMRTFQLDNCNLCAYEGSANCNSAYCYDKQVEWMEQEHDAKRWEERDYRYSFW